MSPFEVLQAIQSAGVGVVGLDLRRTVAVLRSHKSNHIIEPYITTVKTSMYIGFDVFHFI